MGVEIELASATVAIQGRARERGDHVRDVDAERGFPLTHKRDWSFWYPTWEAWKFQRTLSYWVSVMFLEGSLHFIAGAAFSLSKVVDSREGLEYALVATPYFGGAICFTLGAYFGLLEVVNIANATGRVRLCCCFCGAASWRRLTIFATWQSASGYSFYLAGALFYNVNTIAGFLELSNFQSEFLVWVPAILGGTCFVIGGAMECHANEVWKCDVSSGAWWLSMFDFVGAFFFVIAGIAGAFHPEGMLKRIMVDLTYLIGSVAFMLGAQCMMWKWKRRQFGLGLIPEMNDVEGDLERESGVISMHEDYGCGRASPWQIPFLTLYLVNATASVLSIGLAFWPQGQGDWQHELFEGILSFTLSHGVMLLSSIVHHLPTARAHEWLLVYMRIFLAFYTINSWVTVRRQLSRSFKVERVQLVYLVNATASKS